MFYNWENHFGIFMKKLVNVMKVHHPINEATIETQLILSYPALGNGLTEESLLVPAAIKIEFPQSWSTAWIQHVTKLECLLKLQVVTDASVETEKLKEKSVQVILRDSVPTFRAPQEP